MKIMKEWILVVVGFFILASGCKSTEQAVWDNMAGTYTIPSLKIVYVVPTEVENWAVADLGHAIPEIKFCGVDNSAVICVLILEPGLVKSVKEMNAAKVWKLLYEMICQSSTGCVLQFNPDIGQEKYRNLDSWKFRTDVLIANGCDTVGVTYAGYFFDSPNGKMAGIVSIAPTSHLDAVGIQILDKYFDGVRFFAEE